jgi:stage V sporulation protein G
MKITSVNVHKYNKVDSKMLGVASVVLDDCFIIRGLKIIEGDNKLFVSMPRRQTPDGEFHDIVHPLNQETRAMFEETILEEFKKIN